MRQVIARRRCAGLTKPWRDLDRQLRALTPVPGCWSRLGTDNWRIQGIAPAPAHWPTLAPGAIAVQSDGVAVGTGDATMALTAAQPPGRRRLAASDLLNGYAAVLDNKQFS